jgi:hypothetical protein
LGSGKTTLILNLIPQLPKTYRVRSPLLLYRFITPRLARN